MGERLCGCDTAARRPEGRKMWAEFWDWLAMLPAGSASFVGTLTGFFLGLLTLLMGALFNARLNRRRDDTLREADRIAVGEVCPAHSIGNRDSGKVTAHLAHHHVSSGRRLAARSDRGSCAGRSGPAASRRCR